MPARAAAATAEAAIAAEAAGAGADGARAAEVSRAAARGDPWQRGMLSLVMVGRRRW